MIEFSQAPSRNTVSIEKICRRGLGKGEDNQNCGRGNLHYRRSISPLVASSISVTNRHLSVVDASGGEAGYRCPSWAHRAEGSSKGCHCDGEQGAGRNGALIMRDVNFPRIADHHREVEKRPLVTHSGRSQYSLPIIHPQVHGRSATIRLSAKNSILSKGETDVPHDHQTLSGRFCR